MWILTTLESGPAGGGLKEMQASPFLAAHQQAQEEVLLLDLPADRHMVHHLLSYQGYPLVSVDPEQARRAAEAAACRTVALPPRLPQPAAEDVLAEPGVKVCAWRQPEPAAWPGALVLWRIGPGLQQCGWICIAALATLQQGTPGRERASRFAGPVRAAPGLVEGAAGAPGLAGAVQLPGAPACHRHAGRAAERHRGLDSSRHKAGKASWLPGTPVRLCGGAAGAACRGAVRGCPYLCFWVQT